MTNTGKKNKKPLLESQAKAALPSPTEPYAFLESIASLELLAGSEDPNMQKIDEQMNEIMNDIFGVDIPKDVAHEALNRLTRIKAKNVLDPLKLETIENLLIGRKENLRVDDNTEEVILKIMPDNSQMEIETIDDVVTYLNVLAKEVRQLWKDIELMSLLSGLANGTIDENISVLRELGINASQNRAFVVGLTKMLKSMQIQDIGGFLRKTNEAEGMDMLFQNQGEGILIEKINMYANALRNGLQEHPKMYRVLKRMFHEASGDGSVLPRLEGDTKYAYSSDSQN